jgi:nicotinamide riboside transporter PnuC
MSGTDRSFNWWGVTCIVLTVVLFFEVRDGGYDVSFMVLLAAAVLFGSLSAFKRKGGWLYVLPLIGVAILCTVAFLEYLHESKP